MKALGWPVFGILVLVFTAMFATGVYATLHDEDKDPADVAARKAECRKVIDHIIALTPAHGEVKTPIEDVEQCGAAYPESVACMAKAQDLAAVKACIPQGVEADGDNTDVEVKGDHPVFEVTGKAKTVKILVSHARVVIKGSAQAIDIAGSNNNIEFQPPENGKPAPQVSDHGTGNTVKPIEKK